jgi:hypothetical protein
MVTDVVGILLRQSRGKLFQISDSDLEHWSVGP